MEVVIQTLEEILNTLRPIEVDWKDDTARKVIARLRRMPVKDVYTVIDVQNLLEEDFTEGKLICRLFLGLSKDRFEGQLVNFLGPGGTGIMRYKSDHGKFLAAAGRSRPDRCNGRRNQPGVALERPTG